MMIVKKSIEKVKRFFRRTVGQESAISRKMAAIDARHPRLFTFLSLAVLVIFLLGSGYLKFWAAPLSAGVDVPQFWAFAKVFQQHGLDFYQYAGAEGTEFPTQGWGYVYPPVWLLLLRIALFASPASAASNMMIDESWRLAEKTPIIFADLAIGVLLYWAIPGGRLKKLFFAFIWLFHPTAWYNSAVFGQFDAIAAALLLASVILLERGNDRWAFGIAALAVLTKQHVFIPVLLMAAVGLRNLGWRRMLQNAGIFAGVAAAFSLPFLVTGNIKEYVVAVAFPGQMPDYQTPLMYAFSGLGSLLTYFNIYMGWDTQGVFKYFIPVLILAVLAMAYFSYKKKVSASQAALAGFLVFLCFHYRINYQYLVIFIPLALWAAAISRSRWERVFAIAMALAPMVWLWVFDVAFWFYCFKPDHLEVLPLMERLGYFRLGTPDYAYVTIAMVLMGMFITYIALAYTKWKSPGLMKIKPIEK
jgi:hypothetical protein